MSAEMIKDVIQGYVYKVETKSVRDWVITEVTIKKYIGKNKETKKPEYQFVRASTFDKAFADLAEDYGEGDYVSVEGNLMARAWIDKQTGEPRAGLEIKFDDETDFSLLARSKFAGQPDTRPSPMAKAKANYELKQSKTLERKVLPADFDDDIPF